MILAAASFSAVLLRPPPPPDRSHEACPHVLAIVGQDDAALARAELVAIGSQALPAVYDVMDRPHDRHTAADLLEVLGLIGDTTSHEPIRHYLFSEDPQLAALAVRSLHLATGARAVPTLEFILRTGPPYPVALAALEGLEQHAFGSSFETLAGFVESEANDPELRVFAAQILPHLNVKRTRRWLERLTLPATASPFLRTRIESLSLSLSDRRRRR